MADSLTLQQLQSQASPAQILAVSKLQSIDKIRRLHSQGQKKFAENYVQEFVEKQEALRDLSDIEWHFIGHLQRNKVKFLIERIHLIHSVDSLRLAEEINKQAQQHQCTQKILIQVNVSGEASKEGYEPKLLLKEWPQLSQLSHLKIMGLMTMPPLSSDAETNRPFFQELRSLRHRLMAHTDLSQHPLTELSMGTSHDFVVAKEEGASLVRLGTVLFGKRPSKKQSERNDKVT